MHEFHLRVKDHIDSAHFIADYDGKCKRVHGHRWEIELDLEGHVLDTMNMLVDFSQVKKLFKEIIIEPLDHYLLNEEINERNVTAELLAMWIYDNMDSAICGGDIAWTGVRLDAVSVWESPECVIKFTRRNRE